MGISKRSAARMIEAVGASMISLVLVACTSGTMAPSLAAGGPSGPVESAPGASPLAPTNAASSWRSPRATAQAIESDRHRYRAQVPPGWMWTEYAGSWETLDQFGVGVEVPGEDVIDSSALRAFLVMNSMAIPNGMTGAEWLASFDAIVTAALAPDCPGERTEGTFSGQTATIREQTCGGMTIVGRSLVHAGRGYYFTSVAPTDGDADQALAALVESIVFID